MEGKAIQVTGFKIHAAMIAIMEDVGAVGKSGQNRDYKYRKVDDVYAALQLVMAKYKVFTTSEILAESTEERTSKSGGNLIYRKLTIRYTFWHGEDGSSVQSTVIGEGMDSGDKASNKAMAVAHKYALCQAFCIPTDEPKDPEVDSHETTGKGKTSAAPAGNKTQQAKPSQTSQNQKNTQDDQPVWQRVAQTFSKIGVSRDKLEGFLGCKLEEITDDKVQILRQIAQNIKTGKMKVENVFGSAKQAVNDLNEAFT